MIYLDNNATTAIDPRVIDAMDEVYRGGPCNPSSLHALGQQARARVDHALDTIGGCIGTRFDRPGGPRLVITSGGTESNNLALLGIGVPGPVVVSRIEHPSVIAVVESLAAAGRPIRWVDADEDGVVQLQNLEELIGTGPDKASLVSIMSANNETGVIQPIGKVAEICRRCAVPLHVDATQTIGKLPMNLDDLAATTVTFSAHKFHGPTGVGGLWLGPGVAVQPMLHGGQQQLESRPGTEPVALIVGMAAALKFATDEMDQAICQMRSLRDQLEAALVSRHRDLVVQGQAADRLPGTSCIAFVGTDRQSMLMALDMAGVACSSGAACSSGSSPPSHVLAAMNRGPAEIESALRFGASKFSTAAEISRAIESISNEYKRLRQ